MKKRILHLTLTRDWFDQIAMGNKLEEYREIKPYWTSRLIDSNGKFNEFDEVHFTNGYGKHRPFMRVGCGTIHTGFRDFGDIESRVYVIGLNKVLEIKNWSGIKC